LITVLGASGFIGSHLVRKLKNEDIDFYAPTRDAHISKKNLGDIIYCIGLTADFRALPFATVEAHVCFLNEVLRQYEFDSFLYLSSTRVYGARKGIAREDDIIKIQPLNFDDLYNISKIMGESICFATGKDAVRVVRISNVYGYDSKSQNFIFSLIKDALRYKKIVLNTSLDSEKDYVSVEDVVSILPKIAGLGSQKIYNVASGQNITNSQIVNILSEFTGCSVQVDENAQRVFYPDICIDRLTNEFAFTPSNITDDFKGLVSMYQNSGRRKSDKV
jgi:nucleoside-diphosphate-sugar epimerase